jgi:hypothetical protein
MVKNKTLRRMKQEPVRFKRIVKSYKRRVPNVNRKAVVKEYIQSYNSPRGAIRKVAPDNLTRYSQTMWLMDRYGHFVGRANYEGKTSAKGVTKYGYDSTSVIRDAKKYKRIFGRTNKRR